MPMDDMDVAALRRRALSAGLGIDWSQVDDHTVAEFVAWAAPVDAAEGPALHRLSPRLTVAAAPPPPAAASRPRTAPAAAPPPAAEAGSLRPDLDAVAMAETLREAARDGVPFCEECAKAAAARSAEAAPA